MSKQVRLPYIHKCQASVALYEVMPATDRGIRQQFVSFNNNNNNNNNDNDTATAGAAVSIFSHICNFGFLLLYKHMSTDGFAAN